MRVSREKAAQNRERIVDTASRLFREKGFDGVGLNAIMKDAGLLRELAAAGLAREVTGRGSFRAFAI